MSGNSIGKLFCVTTFGESHGPAIGCIIDGCPPGLPLDIDDFALDMQRRKPGTSRQVSQRREADNVEILSGVFAGKTTGTPIALLIRNTDARSSDYTAIKDAFRPGHADFTYHKKYGLRDYRGGGRSSARETAARVAAGVIAKKYLSTHYQIGIQAYLAQMGAILCEPIDLAACEKNAFFCPDESKLSSLENLLQELRREGDSIGARITLQVTNVPVGLGEPVFDRLDADLAHALMGINAVKGVEIGAGFKCVEQKGSQHRDLITPTGFLSNEAGGILGGISTGQDILISLAFKPPASIVKAAQTVNVCNESIEISTKGRHDPCVGIRGVPVAEAMVAIVLLDHLLRQRGQNGLDHS